MCSTGGGCSSRCCAVDGERGVATGGTNSLPRTPLRPPGGSRWQRHGLGGWDAEHDSASTTSTTAAVVRVDLAAVRAGRMGRRAPPRARLQPPPRSSESGWQAAPAGRMGGWADGTRSTPREHDFNHRRGRQSRVCRRHRLGGWDAEHAPASTTSTTAAVVRVGLAGGTRWADGTASTTPRAQAQPSPRSSESGWQTARASQHPTVTSSTGAAHIERTCAAHHPFSQHRDGRMSAQTVRLRERRSERCFDAF